MALIALIPIAVAVAYAGIVAGALVVGWKSLTFVTKVRGLILMLCCLAAANYAFSIDILQGGLDGQTLVEGAARPRAIVIVCTRRSITSHTRPLSLLSAPSP